MSTQFLHIVILTISYILSSNSLSSYRNNNNVIVVKSKVERMKGKMADLYIFMSFYSSYPVLLGSDNPLDPVFKVESSFM